MGTIKYRVVESSLEMKDPSLDLLPLFVLLTKGTKVVQYDAVVEH